MNFLALLASLIAGLSTLIGLIFVFVKIDKNRVEELISFSLSFSSGVIIFLCLFDLIPTSTLYLLEEGSSLRNLIYLFLIFFVGYYIIILLKKIEHFPYQNNLYRVGIISFIILLIHNILEGIITYTMMSYDTQVGLHFTLAIIMHNIPEGILIAVPIYYSNHNRNRAVQLIVFSSLAEPCGALIGDLFLSNINGVLINSYIMILVAGLMLSLIINEVFNELGKYKSYLFENILFFIIGGLFIIINLFFI